MKANANSINQQRVHFSKEEDLYLQLLCQIKISKKDLYYWKQIEKMFNEHFPLSKKTKKQLKYHFQNCLQKHLGKKEFSNEEKEMFRILIQTENLANITRKMNRTYQSVKNYYYRHYQKENSYSIHDQKGKEIFINQNKNFKKDQEICRELFNDSSDDTYEFWLEFSEF
jgi:hypothetical protein